MKNVYNAVRPLK